MRQLLFILVFFCCSQMYAQSSRFEVSNIELISKNKQNFLQLTIKDNKPEIGLYSYPLFKVVSGGKTIAERDLSSYGLVEIELIPTKLKKLPENFECTVYLSGHGDMPNNEKHEMKYKAK